MTASQLATPPPRSSAAATGIFPRVLLAIDFGAASLGAARWAATHAAPGGASFREASVRRCARPRAGQSAGVDEPTVVGREPDAAPQGSIGSVARELLARGPTPVLAVNMP